MDIESDAVVDDSWDINAGRSSGGGDKDGDEISVFMKLEPRKEPYRVRIACRPVGFRKHWDAFRPLGKYPISPAFKESEKDLDVSWSKGNWIPKVKHATLVFDRDHKNKLRVLEGGSQIFGSFQSWSDATRKNPAGPSAPDFLIMVKKVKKGDKTQTEYKVIPDPEGAKPFTAEEVNVLNKTTMSRDWLMAKIYKKASPEEIKALYAQLPDDRKICKAKSDKASRGDGAPPRTASSGVKPESDDVPVDDDDVSVGDSGDEPPEENGGTGASADGDSDDQPAQLF